MNTSKTLHTRRPILGTAAYSLIALLLLAFGAPLQAAVEVQQDAASVTLANSKVVWKFDKTKRWFSIIDAATHEVVLDQAIMAADGWGRKPYDWWEHWQSTVSVQPVDDDFGKGQRVVVSLGAPKTTTEPTYLFTYALYEGSGAVMMGFGMQNTRDFDLRLVNTKPMATAILLPGQKTDSMVSLNGSAGAEPAKVQAGANRDSANSLMLTCTVAGKRRTIVWGGLANKEFGKWCAIKADGLELNAMDPVGRLVDPGQTYWSEDTFYVDVTTADPFVALEQYGRAMRLANHAHPNVYDFPVLCGWSVGVMSHLPDINNSVKLVSELEAAQKAGLTKYTKVGIRLEPDKYHLDSEQGWWDDAHWAKFGHLVAPYDTFAKWCAAIRERDGIPYTYFQVGMPSDDYARAFPGHMLFNDISRLQVMHPHEQPLVSFDYTDPDFQKHMSEVWTRLRKDGIQGIKFDYPETGWRPEGGFENRHATTAFAYREAFRLAREGLGPQAYLDERNIGESKRPCLDVTAGLVDTQRNWTDSNKFVPAMVTIGGLRWYKNRTVFNYFPDTKTVHVCTPGLRQAMLTMVYLTSGRIDLATSFTLFTPEIVHDFSRLYPAYREPFTARPLDAFTGVGDPQVYDLELTPDWHQVALFNSSKTAGPVKVALSGDRVSAGAIGLDPAASYYVYDFWADSLVGKLAGTETITRPMEPSHCAMLSVRKVQANPQVLSTNRHVLQGWVDLADVQWNEKEKTLSGTAKVIGGEPFRITVANNAKKPISVNANQGEAKLKQKSENDLSTIVLERPDNGACRWVIRYR